VLKNWVETDQSQQIVEALRELKKKNISFSSDPRNSLKSGALNLAQLQQGRAGPLLGANSPFRFVLPRERGTLKISFIGVSRAARDRSQVQKVIDLLLRPAVNKRLVELNEEASVLTTLNDSDLPALQKPHYIRELPLSRVDFFVLHEALEPTWLQAMSKEFGKDLNWSK
jgi:spermidine/putrescine-binding protein